MSLLERVIRTHRCRSTHHYVAFDALSLIEGEAADAWKSLMLVHHEHLLKGAKAPDTTFKDFKNHVCHVQEGLWGGAPAKAMEWYARSVELLRRKKWSEAAYAFGVLSHYWADPIQPFHTGQTEEEGVIHRAVEWSIAKSRAEIDRIINESGYPSIEVPEGQGFVAEMVITGAHVSNAFYQDFIDHYDIDRGVSDPRLGFDETLQGAIAYLVAYATAGFAALVSRAIAEAAVAPPKVNLTLQGYIECLDIPLRWLTARLEDASDRLEVERMYKEYQKTGKVIRTLPDDDKLIRTLHARDVLRIPLKQLDRQEIGPIGSLNAARLEDDSLRELEEAIVAEQSGAELMVELVADESPSEPQASAVDRPTPVRGLMLNRKRVASPAPDPELFDSEEASAPVPARASSPPPASISGRRPSLRREDPIVEAPSIGRKTAKRLGKAGITTVADLMDCDPDDTAHTLEIDYIDAAAIIDWQHQARLMMTVPGLRVHDAQILVGAGITNRDELAAAPARTLFILASEFLSSPEGERIIRDDDVLAEAEVEEWIGMAKEAA